MGISKKVIVITGAAGGVGSLLAMGLAKNAHHIVCLGRTEATLARLGRKIIDAGGRTSFKVVDMMDETAIQLAGEQIYEQHGKVDVWINNVGVNNHNAIGPTWELKPDHWWTEVSLNLYTAFMGTRTAIHLMQKRGYGYIINLGGGGVQEPKPFGSAYGAAKTAVVKLTETVNIELEKEGLNIKVFAFNPGFIRNERTEKLVKSEVARKYMPKLGQILEYGKMSDAQDSVDLIEVLISGKADELSGRYFFADDQHIDEIINQKDTFIEEARNLLRVR